MSIAGAYGALVDALGEEQARALWKWATGTEPEWGREGWKRLDQARVSAPGCK